MLPTEVQIEKQKEMIQQITGTSIAKDSTEIVDLQEDKKLSPEEEDIQKKKDIIEQIKSGGKEPAYIEEEEEKKEETTEEISVEDSPEKLKEIIEARIALGAIKGLPEDFLENFEGTEAQLEEVLKYDEEARREEVENSFFDEFQDPFLRDLVKYGLEGGRFADLPRYVEQQQREIDYGSADISKPEIAKAVLTDYLTQKGLSEKQIKRQIEAIEDEDAVEEEAKTAQEYFVNSAQETRKKMAKDDAIKMAETRKSQEAYKRDFQKELKSSKLARQEEQAIVSMLEVEDNLFAFQKKEIEIQRNPAHFIDYLRYINSYNPKEGFQRAIKEEAKKEEITKLKQRFLGTKPLGGSSVKYEKKDSRILYT